MKALLRFNFVSLAATLALVTLGTVAIWSAGGARAETVFHGMWKSNLAAAAAGFGLYALFAAVDYRRLLAWSAIPAYAVALVLLVAVLVFGSTVYGGRRWLWFFQPSELAKLAVIAALAGVFGGPWAARLRGFGGFALAAVGVGLPVLLILAEPDLGTALVLVPAAGVMLFAAGVWRKGLTALVAVGLVAAFVVLGAVYEAEKPGVSAERRARILRCLPLKPHQVRRVKVFLFPEADQLGSGYNLRQSKISIGSGGLTGKGIGRGETNHLKYLPQAISMNDFIFCVYAEETGFVGSLVLLSLFAALVLAGCWTAFRAVELSGRLLALGVTTLLFAHVYVNVAMSVGLVPITGLPLPFVSAGRTFLVTILAALGLVQSVSVHRDTHFIQFKRKETDS